ncbi:MULTISPECIES: hypothetical protein [Sphingobium]|jgi:hypothetical protein|uniref:Uncharacterized protein n=2 Tax=Sphingobium TaxID=165695 RepID=T0HFI0_9SPHN|nr:MULTISPECIES: hypothetical protein [Sphingobium]EQB10838.1 hypothetical protein RLDS_25720 [Sphingobium lactosutens DS20]QDC36528.1 hypothetical protein FIL70_03975 [Sphingobium fuliginis ATCC 27551]
MAEHGAALRTFEPSLGTQWLSAMHSLWEAPLTYYTLWWNACVDNFWPHMPQLHHRVYHEEHDQLVVPDPIEETGEHALFA